ncbi:MAG TPA: DUF1634 domain-containing protein [Nitrososphaerales archaeon]|nr:DUF1634 domain-containing protein [Nitrososphaerales archaeon]
MNLRDPESMNVVIGKVLRYGVILSGTMILLGTIGLVATNGLSDSSGMLTYNPNVVPHDSLIVSTSALFHGLLTFSAFSWIELGVIVLIATPVSRVMISVFLFAAERDRLYVLITAVVLTLLLFSMLVTPFIPGFHA